MEPFAKTIDRTAVKTTQTSYLGYGTGKYFSAGFEYTKKALEELLGIEGILSAG